VGTDAPTLVPKSYASAAKFSPARSHSPLLRQGFSNELYAELGFWLICLISSFALHHRLRTLMGRRTGPSAKFSRTAKRGIELLRRRAQIEIRPLLEYQNYDLENVHIATVTLIKLAQKFVY